MKEERFFYMPDVSLGELPKDEAAHAVRVLRMMAGDKLRLMDGKGTFYQAEITIASNHCCAYRILAEEPQQCPWTGHLHLAMAPTKLNDRTEWLAEKGTEIGIDEFSFLNCQFSERRVMKTERIEKIVVAAMKQSHKAWKPIVNEMQDFKAFVAADRAGEKFICHCYDETDINEHAGSQTGSDKPFLFDILEAGKDATVLIGPEGDFSVEEVRLAKRYGYQSVSLGRSRLRTETAALVAIHIMQLKNQII